MSTRTSSRLAAKAAIPSPNHDSIIQLINNLQGKYYENIREQFNTVTKYYKESHSDIIHFWLDNRTYDLTSFKHRYLLRSLFELVEFKDSRVKQFLENIEDKEILSQMGIIRVLNGTTCHYRIRTGSDINY